MYIQLINHGLCVYRYFFKLMLIDRNGAVDLDDDDDEEELQWESSNPVDNEAVVAVDKANDIESIADKTEPANTSSDSNSLVKENEVLRGQVNDGRILLQQYDSS
jgi:hypothetical protein